jgi:predicted PhzF superfamily epimerase YddE/YHI9
MSELPGVTAGATLRGAVVDAFTTEAFAGNPAAVVLLDRPRDVVWMRRVAAEFNLSDTAFLTPPAGRGSADGGEEGPAWGLRWFTPTTEVELCGHATLASAHWLREMALVGDHVRFTTRSGELSAMFDGSGQVVIDLPLVPVTDPTPLPGVEEVLRGVPFHWVGTTGERRAHGNALVITSAAALVDLEPDLDVLARLPIGGLIVSARPDPGVPQHVGVDVLSRYFTPAHGVPEDPVTGSAHCTLVDHWARVLGREVLRCRQESARGGDLVVSRAGDRALLAGRAVTVWDVTLRL